MSCSSSHALTKKRKVMTKKNVTIWVSELMTWRYKTCHQLVAAYYCTTALTLLIPGSDGFTSMTLHSDWCLPRQLWADWTAGTLKTHTNTGLKQPDCKGYVSRVKRLEDTVGRHTDQQNNICKTIFFNWLKTDNSATFIIGNRNKRAIQVPPVKQSRYFKRKQERNVPLGQHRNTWIQSVFHERKPSQMFLNGILSPFFFFFFAYGWVFYRYGPQPRYIWQSRLSSVASCMR